MKNTGAATPAPGGALLASFTDTARPLGAAWRYSGAHVRALFSTAHPEAVAGSGIACAPPLPAGCISAAQQLANWQWLAAELNALMGEAYTVPSHL